MKHIIMKKTAIVLALAGALAACDSGDNKKAGEKKEATEVSKTAEFSDMYEKAAYSMGVNFSTQMSKNFDSLKEYDVQIDKKLVVQGMRDGFEGKAKFNDEEVQANIETFQAELNEKMQARQAELAAEAKEEAQENLKKGQDFQAEYAKKEGVTTTESGLMYRVIEDVSSAEGDENPTAEDAVRVHYRGTFIDGKEFDSSYKRKKPIDFNLGGVIPGWTEGLQYMTPGDKYEFVIPSDLAYGENDRGSIPGNSTLIFDVELLAINPEEPYQAPVEEQVKEAGEDIKDGAEKAAEEVKETATDAAKAVKEGAEDAAEKVEKEAKEMTDGDK